jgi:hypothetical protein
MHVAGEKFIVSVCSPLELTIQYHVKNLSKDSLGTGLQAHINTLRSRGFEPQRIFVDPHKALAALQGSFPGIEVDVSGAGDHLDKVDTKIRRLKELMRSVIAGLPYKLPKERLKDLVTYAVCRTNIKSTTSLNDNVSPRVRFTGFRPDYKHEFGLAFGDYVEAYNPRSAERSNDVTVARTEPCIALYPAANRNGSWMMYNLHTNTYVRRSRWTKVPINQLVRMQMNALAGDTAVESADISRDMSMQEESIVGVQPHTHTPLSSQDVNATPEELAVLDEDVPALMNQELDNDDSDSESDPNNVDEDDDDPDDDERFEAELEELEQREQDILPSDSSDSLHVSEQQQAPPLRRTARSNAGVRRYDDDYQWNLMNLSVDAAIRGFGESAREACKEELLQLFREKKALVPVKWHELTEEQKAKTVRSHMFLREKYEDGKFIKMKGRIVADGRMQDRTVYTDYSSPTAKTRSVITCLKLAAVKGWDLLKVDVGGAFLCAPINEDEEVFMTLDDAITYMAIDWMPELQEYVRTDGKLTVRVDKAMYGLIQSAKLWYNELTRYLLGQGFKKCPSDDCILIKYQEGKQPIIVILYVDDILIMANRKEDRYWVKDILEQQYKKVTVTEGARLPYLGMTIIRTDDGFEICMQAYIEEVLKLYGNQVKKCITPAKPNLFKMTEKQALLKDRAAFHSVVAKLLYLGKRGRPDILLPVQFLCTRVQNPTVEDGQKLQRVLGYLRLTKHWTRRLDSSPLERVESYIDASFATHPDGKSQSGCMVFLGQTLVHETCRKQKLITKNSTEAELVALADHFEEGELIETFLMDLGHLLGEDIVSNVHLVYQDNQSTISLVTTGGGQARSKYMKVRQEYVKERLDCAELEIQYVPTSKMVADVLTKPLGGELFHAHVRTILGRHQPYQSNRGAKSKMKHSESDVGLAVTLKGLSCSDQKTPKTTPGSTPSDRRQH